MVRIRKIQEPRVGLHLANQLFKRSDCARDITDAARQHRARHPLQDIITDRRWSRTSSNVITYCHGFELKGCRYKGKKAKDHHESRSKDNTTRGERVRQCQYTRTCGLSVWFECGIFSAKSRMRCVLHTEHEVAKESERNERTIKLSQLCHDTVP